MPQRETEEQILVNIQAFLNKDLNIVSYEGLHYIHVLHHMLFAMTLVKKFIEGKSV